MGVWLSRVESTVPTVCGLGWRLSLALLHPPPGALRNHGKSASPILPDSLIPCQGSHNFLQTWWGAEYGQGGGQVDLE